MYIYDQIREDTLYIMLYTIVTVMTAMACIYLLFRQGNAFSKDITPPTRLRRWTAAFFGAFALNHVWYKQRKGQPVTAWMRDMAGITAKMQV